MNLFEAQSDHWQLDRVEAHLRDEPKALRVAHGNDGHLQVADGPLHVLLAAVADQVTIILCANAQEVLVLELFSVAGGLQGSHLKIVLG